MWYKRSIFSLYLRRSGIRHLAVKKLPGKIIAVWQLFDRRKNLTSERKEFFGKAQAAVRHVRSEGVKRAQTYRQ
jgi:hypothetical protein